LDKILYEAESVARKLDERVLVVEGKRSRRANESSFNELDTNDNHQQKWTGVGYVKAFYGDTVVFEFQHAHKIGFYDLVLRYESVKSDRHSNNWELGVRVVDLNETEFGKINTSCSYTRREFRNKEKWTKLDSRKRK
jgi:hypothetical protein